MRRFKIANRPDRTHTCYVQFDANKSGIGGPGTKTKTPRPRFNRINFAFARLLIAEPLDAAICMQSDSFSAKMKNFPVVRFGFIQLRQQNVQVANSLLLP